MKKMKLSVAAIMLATFGISANLNAQVSGDNAFMIGDFVEVGISQHGYEGAPLDVGITTHYRGMSGRLGFVANPREDDWTQYNGDFYLPGSPESGFGIGFTRDGSERNYGNNATGLTEIIGEITSYYDTADSIIVKWEGMPASDSLMIKLTYTLKKNEHFYRTFIEFDNLGSETYSDVYYYRTLDPDNNQDIEWGFATQNTIVSQSGMANDSVIVTASSTDAWTAIMLFEAFGPEWKGFAGGFANRDASEMWDGTGSLIGTEGFSTFADQAIGISLKIDALPPGRRAESEVYSFATAFKTGIDYEIELDTDGLTENGQIDFNMYPNPNEGDLLDIRIDGEFIYSIVDLKGSIILNGQGNGFTEINLSSLDQGIYIIKIEQDGVQATEKLIIE